MNLSAQTTGCSLKSLACHRARLLHWTPRSGNWCGDLHLTCIPYADPIGRQFECLRRLYPLISRAPGPDMKVAKNSHLPCGCPKLTVGRKLHNSLRPWSNQQLLLDQEATRNVSTPGRKTKAHPACMPLGDHSGPVDVSRTGRKVPLSFPAWRAKKGTRYVTYSLCVYPSTEFHHWHFIPQGTLAPSYQDATHQED